MLIRRLPIAVLLVTVLLLAACQSTPGAADPADKGDVDTRGWETPNATPAADSSSHQREMEEFRRQNKELRKQVAQLSDKVEEMKDAAPPEPAPQAEPEEAAPVAPETVNASAETLYRAMKNDGLSDLEVTQDEAGHPVVILPGSISFRAGQADLMATARARLARLAGIIQRLYPDVTLRIEGHTDSDPIRKSKWESNQVLSQARAAAVGKHLVAVVGWPDRQLETRGFGADKPIATNATREGKARNRRVEIVLVP
jgi:flagellar motor protein MotB